MKDGVPVRSIVVLALCGVIIVTCLALFALGMGSAFSAVLCGGFIFIAGSVSVALYQASARERRDAEMDAVPVEGLSVSKCPDYWTYKDSSCVNEFVPQPGAPTFRYMDVGVQSVDLDAFNKMPLVQQCELVRENKLPWPIVSEHCAN